MMLTPLFAEFSGWHYLYTGWLSLLSIFLILVILVQRGRGGGLTGALGGMGGQSTSAPKLATCSPRSPLAWPSSGFFPR